MSKYCKIVFVLYFLAIAWVSVFRLPMYEYKSTFSDAGIERKIPIKHSVGDIWQRAREVDYRAVYPNNPQKGIVTGTDIDWNAYFLNLGIITAISASAFVTASMANNSRISRADEGMRGGNI